MYVCAFANYIFFIEGIYIVKKKTIASLINTYVCIFRNCETNRI